MEWKAEAERRASEISRIRASVAAALDTLQEHGSEPATQHNLSPRRRMKVFTDLSTPYSKMLGPRMIIEDYLQFTLSDSSAGFPSQEPQTVLGPNKQYTAICNVID